MLKSKITALFLAVSAMAGAVQANPVPFGAWVQQFKAEAVAQGISPQLLEQAFAGVTPDERIIVLDRKQPEGTMTLSQYLTRVVADARIREGRKKYQQYKPLLEQIGAQYGVQPRFIVALWGIETNYGSNTGGFNIVEALATLAYDGRRSDFFRSELMHAMQILQQGHVQLASFNGSWAGAMGQTQFMPSSFFSHAVDYNGDGHKDIWGTQADVFASIANYLRNVGWNDDLTWGREVRLPAGFDASQADMSIKKTLPEWSAAGVKNLDGSALPDKPEISGSIILPDGAGGRAFVVYNNFDCLLKWNRSKYFATAVGRLADSVAW